MVPCVGVGATKILGLQEMDVVRDLERIQWPMWKRMWFSRTNLSIPQKQRRDIATGPHHRAKEEK